MKPTAAMLAVQRMKERERFGERLRERANPEQSYEESKKVRDAILAERAEAEKAQDALARQFVTIRNRQLGHAYALLAARCNDEDDAKRRIKADESDRSRQRLPVYTLYLDGAKAWEGAFENGTIEEGTAHWLERWLTYASPDLPFYVRWLAEPLSTLKQIEDRYEAGVIRDDRRWHAKGVSAELAIEALYEQIDAAPEQRAETVQ